MNGSMYEWMDGRADGWADRRMDSRWAGGWIDG